ncbi:hypothetical protein QW71_12935 [Paenibacillus sp. IHB B 3415]|uniref:hypothetical protein n=1 Tax=Paenibacillus sp. IHB B 3415 TaxID=867080 RepID=UPI000574BCBC|nr:hypothetical protein [Paenibacillus sp. IHB B 3415]KHL95365.1 hypothetical protein QW71_12935 [Paenibacillus sp. IHB B 3415]
MNEQQRKALVEMTLLTSWKYSILNEAMSLLTDQSYTREQAGQKLLEVVADMGDSEQACLSSVIDARLVKDY